MNLNNNLLSDAGIPTGKQFEEKMLSYVRVIGLTNIDMVLPELSITCYDPMHANLHEHILSLVLRVVLA